MHLNPFHLERYFAQYEFSVRYLLSSSDCDGLRQQDLLTLADAETRALWENLTLGYTESQGHPLLRAEIAKLYPGLAASDCLVVVPEEGIFLTMHALLQPGDHVICTFPGYQSLYEIAQGLGCSVTRWQPHEADGWRFDPDDLAAAIRPTTKLIVVNFPHNPTGYLPSQADFQRILELARAHDIYLFSDEMYRFLEYSPSDRLPAACAAYPRAVSLFGMSKTYGLAGLRIGWLATQDRNLLARILTLKDYTTICSSAPAEILALIGLRAHDQIVATHQARLAHNLRLLDDFFAAYPDLFSWARPHAGTIGFPRLAPGIDALAFCQELVQRAGVMLLPATVYDYGSQHVRLGFGRANLPVALAELRAYLDRR